MLKILIIDPDPRDTARLVRELESQGFGFNACHVRTLGELQASLEGGRPDLILSETKICGADGFSALEMARDYPPWMPFVFISKTHDPGLIVEIFENGGNGYISKHHFSELREVILQAQLDGVEPSVDDHLAEAPVSAVRDKTKPIGSTPNPAGTVNPICPCCKRIGASDGDWQPVEVHLRLHRQATVSLGTCPDCAEAGMRK